MGFLMEDTPMRKFLFLAISGAMLFTAGTALADDMQAATQQPVTVAVSTTPDAKICKAYYHEGMLIRSHCMTRAQWDSLRHYDEEQVSEFQVTTSRLGVFK
jgi:hypothetical protein